MPRRINICRRRIHIELGFLMTNELEVAGGLLTLLYFSFYFCFVRKTNSLFLQKCQVALPLLLFKKWVEKQTNKQTKTVTKSMNAWVEHSLNNRKRVKGRKISELLLSLFKVKTKRLNLCLLPLLNNFSACFSLIVYEHNCYLFLENSSCMWLV